MTHNKILNPRLAPNWLTNVKVIERGPNLGASGTGPLTLTNANKCQQKTSVNHPHQFLVLANEILPDQILVHMM